jgi:TPR repeat protein
MRLDRVSSAVATHSARGCIRTTLRRWCGGRKPLAEGIQVHKYSLGFCYMHGAGSHRKNAVCAKIFMKAAAAQGHLKAIEDLKELNACAACGAPDASRTCMGCLSCTGISVARYCTPACHKKHWRRHKRDCGGLKACKCRSCISERGEGSTTAAPA